MIKIIESAGDITLHKFIFIPTPNLDIPEYKKYYDDNLRGYYIQWDYHYNTLTRQTDDRNVSHADVIDNLPDDLRRAYRQNDGSGWGRTDYRTSRDIITYFISDGINKKNIPYIKKMIGVK